MGFSVEPPLDVHRSGLPSHFGIVFLDLLCPLREYHYLLRRNGKSMTVRLGSFDDLFARAYDRESPCFYAAQGWRNEYGKSAWLKNEEVADIANVLMLAKADGGTQAHLSQVDRANPDGAETWDAGRVRDELRSRGLTAFSSVSQASSRNKRCCGSVIWLSTGENPKNKPSKLPLK